MLVVEPVGDRNVALVPPAPITRLITSHQDHASLSLIEGKERAIVAVSQFLHVVVAGTLDRFHKRSPKTGSDLGQTIQSLRDPLPIVGTQRPQPLLDLRLDLNLPRHAAGL